MNEKELGCSYELNNSSFARKIFYRTDFYIMGVSWNHAEQIHKKSPHLTKNFCLVFCNVNRCNEANRP